jgi:sugar phosphate isomerase/epimerase
MDANRPKPITFGLISSQLPGTTAAEKLLTAREAGADFVVWALSNAEVDAWEASETDRFCQAVRQSRFPVRFILVDGITRWSEIYTHPQSREASLRRLTGAAELAARLGATLILAVKEVVPADVAVPAYKVGWRAIIERAEQTDIPLILEPANWPLEDALELIEGIGSPHVRLCLSESQVYSTGGKELPHEEVCRIRISRGEESGSVTIPAPLLRFCSQFILDLASVVPPRAEFSPQDFQLAIMSTREAISAA